MIVTEFHAYEILPAHSRDWIMAYGMTSYLSISRKKAPGLPAIGKALAMLEKGDCSKMRPEIGTSVEVVSKAVKLYRIKESGSTVCLEIRGCFFS